MILMTDIIAELRGWSHLEDFKPHVAGEHLILGIWKDKDQIRTLALKGEGLIYRRARLSGWSEEEEEHVAFEIIPDADDWQPVKMSRSESDLQSVGGKR